MKKIPKLKKKGAKIDPETLTAALHWDKIAKVGETDGNNICTGAGAGGCS